MIQQTTLLELNTLIKDTLYSSFEQAYWVVAEISELKINRNGHCYLELIEKDKVDDHIIARSRATIWAYTFRILKPYFEKVVALGNNRDLVLASEDYLKRN